MVSKTALVLRAPSGVAAPGRVRADRAGAHDADPGTDLAGLGLPADFLIAPDGRIAALKYGLHAYDQWTVDELLGHAHPVPP